MFANESDETFTVSVTGAGVDIKREVSVARLTLIMSVVMGSDPPQGGVLQGPSASESSKSTKVSLREFLDETKAATKPDQIVAIGHYISAHEGKDTFSRDDIKARFQSARERLPANFPRDFNTAISKAMIAEDHLKAGQYYVTKKGLQAVERRFGAQT
jgi:hypothetical protein